MRNVLLPGFAENMPAKRFLMTRTRLPAGLTGSSFALFSHPASKLSLIVSRPSSGRRRGRGGIDNAAIRRRSQAKRFELLSDLIAPLCLARQGLRFDDLVQGNRLQIEESIGERLNALGTSQMRPFGAQHADFVLFPFDLVLKLYDRLGMENRFVFDRIGIDRGTDKRRDRQNIQ